MNNIKILPKIKGSILIINIFKSNIYNLILTKIKGSNLINEILKYS